MCGSQWEWTKEDAQEIMEFFLPRLSLEEEKSHHFINLTTLKINEIGIRMATNAEEEAMKFRKSINEASGEDRISEAYPKLRHLCFGMLPQIFEEFLWQILKVHAKQLRSLHVGVIRTLSVINLEELLEKAHEEIDITNLEELCLINRDLLNYFYNVIKKKSSIMPNLERLHCCLYGSFTVFCSSLFLFFHFALSLLKNKKGTHVERLCDIGFKNNKSVYCKFIFDGKGEISMFDIFEVIRQKLQKKATSTKFSSFMVLELVFNESEIMSQRELTNMSNLEMKIEEKIGSIMFWLGQCASRIVLSIHITMNNAEGISNLTELKSMFSHFRSTNGYQCCFVWKETRPEENSDDGFPPSSEDDEFEESVSLQFTLK